MPPATKTGKSRPKPRPKVKTGARPKAATARARRSSATWRPRLPHLEQRHYDLMGLALVAAGVFLAFPLFLGWDAGAAGAAMTDGLAFAVGAVRYAVPVGLVAAGAVLVLRPVLPSVRPFRSGAICLFAALVLGLAAGTLGLGPDGARDEFWKRAFFEERGGIAGEALFYAASKALATIGAHIVALFLFLAAVLLLTGASVAGVMRATGSGVADTTRALKRVRPAARGGREAPDGPQPMSPPEPDGEEPMVRAGKKGKGAGALALDAEHRFPDLFGEPDGDDLGAALEEPLLAPAAETGDEAFGPDDPLPRVQPPLPFVPAIVPERVDGEEPEWHLPAATLLRRSTEEQSRPDTAGQAETAARLVEALSHFGVEAKVIGTIAGPHITRYELLLAPGVKMSKVAQMKDDLAYALAATEIRILAPIPGKQAVGVEVPNLRRKIVQLGDVISPPPEGSSPLTVWLGKDVSGKAIHADLAKMPHLLVAGTTGAGKSGCVNAMLSSILLQATPDEVRLVLVDPKQVELNHYEAIPHLLTPVITSPRAAANALQNLVREMEWRYGIMAMARTRSLPELNRWRLDNEQESLPYILCVIDELADLMMVAPADVEDSIIRLAQKARAVGIHLVLATQSPRVDVITGMIKANVPSRIAFAVSSQTDSRVILDQNGAESLLGMGDMLFSPVGTSRLHRIQGAYIDEPQIAAVTEFWAAQGEPQLREDLLEEVEPAADAGGSGEDDGFDPDEDELLGDAISLVVEMGTASTSMLQRRLRLGYTRAGRLIDMLERRGIISGYEGSKPRQVLVTEGDLPRVLAALSERTAAEPPGEPQPVDAAEPA